MLFSCPKRPFYVVAVTVFFTTAFLVAKGETYGFIVAMIAALCLAFVLCIPPLRRIGVVYLVIFGVMLSALCTYLHYARSVLPLAAFDGKTVTVTARVDAVDEQYFLTVTEQGDLPKGTRLAVTIDDEKWHLERYAFLHGRVSLYVTESTTLHGDGVFLAGKVDMIQQTASPQATVLETVSDTLRYRFLEGLYETLPSEQAAFLAGVCVGDTAGLPDDVVMDFRKSGLAHLIVVSGLHMTILSGAVLGLLHCLRVRRDMATVITLPLVWLFMLTVGLSVSVVRAAVMLHCLLLGGVFRRRTDGRTSLSVALLLIVLQNPYAVCDVGFLLSFAATWGLIVLVPLWNKLVCLCDFIANRAWLQKLLQPIGCSLAAMVFTAPVCAMTFGSLAVLSPVANVLTGWPVTVMLPSAFLGGIVYQLPFLRVIAIPCLRFGGILAQCVMASARFVASLPMSVWQIRQPVWLVLLVLFPFAVCWSVKLYGKRGVLRVLVANTVIAVCLCVFFNIFLHRNVFVRVAASGYSTVTVVETALFTAAVISGENTYAYTAAKWYFSACGIDKLDVLVVTDSNTKYRSDLSDLLKTTPAKTVICPAEDALDGAVLLENGATFMHNEQLSFSTVDGWWRLDIGKTRVLFTKANSLVSKLPRDWQKTHLAVVRQSVPDDIHLLTAQNIVAVCVQKHTAAVKAQLTDVVCPVVINRQASFCTTGQGDLITSDNFWLG